jgi:hypothetical protein
MRRIFCAAAAAVLLAGLLAACGGTTAHHASSRSTSAVTQPTAPADTLPVDTSPPDTAADDSAPATAAAGQTINLSTDAGDSVDVTLGKVAFWRRGGGDDPTGPQYARFLVVKATLQATSGSFDYNADDFYVRMGDGQRYDQGGGNVCCSNDFGQQLQYGTLHAGQRVKGVLVFDIPRGHGAIVYGTGRQDDVAEWAF